MHDYSIFYWVIISYVTNEFLHNKDNKELLNYIQDSPVVALSFKDNNVVLLVLLTLCTDLPQEYVTTTDLESLMS